MFVEQLYGLTGSGLFVNLRCGRLRSPTLCTSGGGLQRLLRLRNEHSLLRDNSRRSASGGGGSGGGRGVGIATIVAVAKEKEEAKYEHDIAISQGRMTGLVEHVTDDSEYTFPSSP